MCALLTLLVAALTGCGGGDAPSEPPPPAAIFSSLSLTASTTTIHSRPPGNFAAVTARALDQDGQPMNGLGNATFTSDDAGIATVDASGTVTAVASGATNIRASLTANGVTHAASLWISVVDSEPTATVTAPFTTFTPQSVAIAQGGTVTWTFASVMHNVVFTTAGAPADLLDPWTERSRSRTFPEAGTFRYQCTIHAGMTGEVIVR